MGRKSSVQIKPIISGVRGQKQLPVVKENRIPAWVLSWDRANFGSQKTYFSSSTVLTCSLVSQDRSLCGGIKWMCRCLTLEEDYCVPSHQHTINKKAMEPEVAGVYVCTSGPGQLLHSSGLCCVLGFWSLQEKRGQMIFTVQWMSKKWKLDQNCHVICQRKHHNIVISTIIQ